jgi:UPF0755 protein
MAPNRNTPGAEEAELLEWMGAAAPVEDFGRSRYGSTTRTRPGSGQTETGPSRGEVDDGYDADAYDAFLVTGARRRDEVRIPRRGGWLRRIVFSAGALGLVGLLVAGGVALWAFRQVDPPGPPGAELTLTIPEGATGDDITKLLADNDVIANASVFRQYIRVRGQDEQGRFQSGVYTFNLNSSMNDALSALERGPVPPVTVAVTIPEGLRLSDALDLIAQNVPWFDRGRLQAALDTGAVPNRFRPEGGSYEGLLFPDTYEILEGSTEIEFLTRMSQQFERVAGQLGVDNSAERYGYTPYQIVVLASLIEREARVAEDRPKIARVLFNRMEQDMRLDIDATVLYALGRTSGDITVSDLEVDSPYNTRLYKGIPPTPIALPSRASMEAIMAPASGNWLFYVLADPSGAHYFTGSYNDFLSAQAEAEEKGLI